MILVVLCVLLAPLLQIVCISTDFRTASGHPAWVDPETPSSAQQIETSRGQVWALTFSDEFNTPQRDFRPGGDHLWTAIEIPDGVNAALEYYSFNMTSTIKDSDGRGVLQIETRTEENITFQVYNAYASPPGYMNHSMYYRSGMIQTWNKFCFQGGLLEVMAKLPGAINKESGNPDLAGDVLNRVEKIEYYPTWPGIWLMGNLGRALFTDSTNRMWPWSYNECNYDLKKDQRISACDRNPGFGLNPRQGRGAPEIDLIEGGGVAISTSIQIAPGMPPQFRLFPPDKNIDSNVYCVYARGCQTLGANVPGVPTFVYEKRGHRSWYQDLKYFPNTNCNPVGSLKQSAAAVIQNREIGVTSNNCTGLNTCSASYDGNAYLGKKDNTSNYWGVNEDGGCMPVMNAYQGSYLCDPANTNSRCTEPKKEGNVVESVLPSFNYQMDAISANSEIPLKAYTGYMKYQIEWIPSSTGYIRWILDDVAIFEIAAESLTSPPQDSSNSNFHKVMVEEPMYIIFNVALSTSWGSKPPNPGKPCKGDGTDAKINKICDAFPMYMKVDYVRLYQDASSMRIGCDPASHPTKTWIDEHLSEYQDSNNPVKSVVGQGSCRHDDDCSVGAFSAAFMRTGKCVKKRCQCLFPSSWVGPRCTTSLDLDAQSGPSVTSSLIFGSIAVAVMLLALYNILFTGKTIRHNREFLKAVSVGDYELVDLSQASDSADVTIKAI
ncbi:hypothetical protein ABG067_003784 [Albugo candida]